MQILSLLRASILFRPLHLNPFYSSSVRSVRFSNTHVHESTLVSKLRPNRQIKWWRRRVPPPGPLRLFHRAFSIIAGKPGNKEYKDLQRRKQEGTDSEKDRACFNRESCLTFDLSAYGNRAVCKQSLKKTGSEPSEALITAVVDITAVIRFTYRKTELYPRFH